MRAKVLMKSIEGAHSRRRGAEHVDARDRSPRPLAEETDLRCPRAWREPRRIATRRAVATVRGSPPEGRVAQGDGDPGEGVAILRGPSALPAGAKRHILFASRSDGSKHPGRSSDSRPADEMSCSVLVVLARILAACWPGAACRQYAGAQ